MTTQLSAQSYALLLRLAPPTPLDWGDVIEAGGRLLLIALPCEQIAFDSSLGFWPHVIALQGPEGQSFLLLQLNSFLLADGPGRSWAIPLGAPGDESQRLLAGFGFTEGWEESRPETMLLFGPEWATHLRLVKSRRQLGITVQGAESAYPMALGSSQLLQLDTYLELACIGA